MFNDAYRYTDTSSLGAAVLQSKTGNPPMALIAMSGLFRLDLRTGRLFVREHGHCIDTQTFSFRYEHQYEFHWVNDKCIFYIVPPNPPRHSSRNA
jgi:hypothetical protein